MATVVGNWGGGAIWRMASGAFASNSYFCEADLPGGGVLIDAGLDGQKIDAELREHGLRPHQVFCTHGHFDHAGSASLFQRKYGCQVFVHGGDAATLKASNFLLMAFNIPHRVELPVATYVGDEFSIGVAGKPLRYLPSPGHTPGSCVLELGTAWFTGDTIYSSGVGLSRLPGEDAGRLKESVRNLWSGLTSERTICPGHGGTASGAAVRRDNHALIAFLGPTIGDPHAT